MMRKVVKKVMSFALCLIMLLQIVGVDIVKAEEYNGERNFEIIESKRGKMGNIVLEISKLGNIFFYFEDNGNEVISYTLSENIVDYAINDGIILYSGSLQVGSDDFIDIKEKIFSIKDDTKKVRVEDAISKTTGMNSRAATDHVSIIKNLLNSKGYQETALKLIKTKTTAVTAYLYESCSYGISKISTWHIVAGTTISFVTALVGLSANSLMSILGFAIAADGLYHLIKDSDITKYDAVVNRLKIVKVRDNYPYNTYSNVVYTAWITNTNDCALNYEYTNECSDYFDNDAILLKGLSNAGF